MPVDLDLMETVGRERLLTFVSKQTNFLPAFLFPSLRAASSSLINSLPSPASLALPSVAPHLSRTLVSNGLF